MTGNEMKHSGGGLSRRRFLQGLAASTVAAAGLAGCAAPQADSKDESLSETGEGSTSGYQYDWETAEGEIVHGVCPKNCYDTCRICTKVVDGTAVQIRGDAGNPWTAGSPCVKGQTYLDYHYSEDRILYPMKRVGAKGPGAQFERISWDEAVAIITDRFKEIIANEGSEAIVPYTFSGTFGLINGCFFSGVLRFLYRMGAAVLMPNMCEAAGVAAIPYTLGAEKDVDPEQYGNTDLYVSWGSNVSATSVHTTKFLKDLCKNGGKIVVVNPVRIPICEWADMWVQLRSGTDVPFVLGVIKHMVDNNLYNAEYVEAHCMGFDELKKTAEPWTADKVAEVCDIPAEQVAQFAELYAAAPSSIIQIGLQMSRATNGGSKVRAITFLPALTGQYGKDAHSGIMHLTACYWSVNVGAIAMGPEFIGGGTPGGGYVTTKEQLDPNIKYRIINIADYGDCLNEEGNYKGQPARACFVYNGNPLVSAPNTDAIRRGLARDEMFVVVSDKWYTDTTDYADIILPCTDILETEDIHQDYHAWYLNHNTPAVAPAGEAKDNIEMANMLAKAMGYTDACFDDDIPALIEQLLADPNPIYGEGLTYDKLKKDHWVKLIDFVPYADELQNGFATPSGKIEFYSQQLKDLGLPPVVEYAPHAESRDGSPELFATYPLQFVTATSKNMCGGNWHNIGKTRLLHGQPLLYINAADAQARSIADGDAVEVFNDRGVCNSLVAQIVEDDVVAPGTVLALKSTWPKFMDGKTNVNSTTPSYWADFGMGTTFQSNLVEVRKA